MKICKHQEYCKNNHDYIPCPQQGCIWGNCQTCDIFYNPLFDCSKLPDEDEQALKDIKTGKTKMINQTGEEFLNEYYNIITNLNNEEKK